MTWPRDEAKLARVRALMVEHDLDALVVRAPDNVLYLTNYWSIKGYDMAVFPRLARGYAPQRRLSRVCTAKPSASKPAGQDVKIDPDMRLALSQLEFGGPAHP